MNKSKIKPYAVSILLTLAVGGLRGFLTSMGMDSFDALTKPPFTPPSFLFPIVWTVLFILMGVGAARIFMTEPTAARNRALIVYVVQLAVNFFWSIIFFNFQQITLIFSYYVGIKSFCQSHRNYHSAASFCFKIIYLSDIAPNR
ncbi:MAG: TspO/MBR family protein [Oscillospiraceae bacterium]|nr:TspO/MBR family protein [Oscillospiraceae bacterium]